MSALFRNITTVLTAAQLMSADVSGQTNSMGNVNTSTLKDIITICQPTRIDTSDGRIQSLFHDIIVVVEKEAPKNQGAIFFENGLSINYRCDARHIEVQLGNSGYVEMRGDERSSEPEKAGFYYNSLGGMESNPIENLYQQLLSCQEDIITKKYTFGHAAIELEEIGNVEITDIVPE